MYILNEQRFLNVIGLGKSIISMQFMLLSFRLVCTEGLHILPCAEPRLDYFTFYIGFLHLHRGDTVVHRYYISKHDLTYMHMN